ncbi:MAG: hypothetical protein IJN43_13770 [Ruminococcus sp.]|nr:hypothetical protein [Ruminococcus sp.]
MRPIDADALLEKLDIDEVSIESFLSILKPTVLNHGYDIFVSTIQIGEIQRLNDLLQEYKDLEEQGLLLRLPCKIGDTVYLVSTCGRSDIDGRFIRVIEEKTFSEFWLRDIGKTVFLTYGEAVAKLKELEG